MEAGEKRVCMGDREHKSEIYWLGRCVSLRLDSAAGGVSIKVLADQRFIAIRHRLIRIPEI